MEGLASGREEASRSGDGSLVWWEAPGRRWSDSGWRSKKRIAEVELFVKSSAGVKKRRVV
jgi:hypothetical protein